MSRKYATTKAAELRQQRGQVYDPHNQRHESPELGDAAFRLMRGLARRAGDGDTEALEQLAKLSWQLADMTAAAAAGLRRAGYSWGEIGALTGHTRQNAFQRWGRSTIIKAHPDPCRCGRSYCPRKAQP
jgi:hypothetical protein